MPDQNRQRQRGPNSTRRFHRHLTPFTQSVESVCCSAGILPAFFFTHAVNSTIEKHSASIRRDQHPFDELRWQHPRDNRARLRAERSSAPIQTGGYSAHPSHWPNPSNLLYPKRTPPLLIEATLSQAGIQ
jgi:hypothetical protein